MVPLLRQSYCGVVVDVNGCGDPLDENWLPAGSAVDDCWQADRTVVEAAAIG
jgi:hypothetical protein